MQPLYYVLESLDELKALTRMDIMANVVAAKRLGLHAPLFAPKQSPADAKKKAA